MTMKTIKNTIFHNDRLFVVAKSIYKNLYFFREILLAFTEIHK